MNKLKRIIEPKKTLLIIGLVIIALGLLEGGALIFLIIRKEPTSLSTVTQENIYSKVDVELVTDYFATLTTDSDLEKYYFVIEDGYTYIAKLDDETFAKLQDNYDYNYSTDAEENAPSAVEIVGLSASIPDEIKTFAIEYFQEVEGLDVTEENFNNLVYPYLIDTYSKQTDRMVDIAIIFSLIIMVGLIFIMLYINKIAKIRNGIKKYSNSLDIIAKEMEKETAKHNRLCRAYITKNYLICYGDIVEIIELSDISWIYPFEYHTNGVITSRSIHVYTKDKKKHVIGVVNKWKKEKEEAYRSFYQLLMKKTPDALHGYSKENKDIALK